MPLFLVPSVKMQIKLIKYLIYQNKHLKNLNNRNGRITMQIELTKYLPNLQKEHTLIKKFKKKSFNRQHHNNRNSRKKNYYIGFTLHRT